MSFGEEHRYKSLAGYSPKISSVPTAFLNQSNHINQIIKTAAQSSCKVRSTPKVNQLDSQISSMNSIVSQSMATSNLSRLTRQAPSQISNIGGLNNVNLLQTEDGQNIDLNNYRTIEPKIMNQHQVLSEKKTNNHEANADLISYMMNNDIGDNQYHFQNLQEDQENYDYSRNSH